MNFARYKVTNLVFTVGLILMLAGCSGSNLKVWHTRSLSAEYNAGKFSEIQSIDDYLLLEEALFEQLDSRIYDSMPTGAEHALDRYSSGSAADPRNRNPDWNRSFETGVGGERGGILLLHGMSDSPYSLRSLGEALADQGFRVLGLRLPGHGTIPAGLTSVQWEDMAEITSLGMAHLRAQLGSAPIHILGYSTGAALAIDYALEADLHELPESLVLISPAIGVSRAASLASWKRGMSYLPGLRRLAWTGLAPEFDPYKYNSFATNAAEQVHLLTRSINGRIEQNQEAARRFPPTLVVVSAVDATVSLDAVVDRFLVQLAPGTHELLVFDVNRLASTTALMRDDPGPIIGRLLGDDELPFAVTLVANENPESRAVIASHKPAHSSGPVGAKPLGVEWPPGVFSLSHVALPFPPDDPLYGRYPPEDRNQLFLGLQAMQGERGLLKISPNFLLRLRHNPFYDYMEGRVVDWLATAGQQ
ncbi:MAG: alpha/beta fold hydrolase [Halioglobus sp.]